MNKIKGKVITTETNNQEIFDDNLEQTVDFMTNVQINNMGTSDCNIIINEGDVLLLQANETLSLGEVTIYTIVVKEKGSKIRYIGVQ